jgi:hypothetical protein
MGRGQSRVKLALGKRVESANSIRKNTVKTREKRRSRKGRERSRLAAMLNSEGPDPTSACRVEQTCTSHQTVDLPGGCENLGRVAIQVDPVFVTSSDHGAERDKTLEDPGTPTGIVSASKP